MELENTSRLAVTSQSYKASPGTPRTIWMYWENVYSDKMPDYIRLCYETICAHSQSLNVVLLTPENVRDYVPSLREDFELIPQVAHKADYIRAAVLAENGGMWMDIDSIAIRPIRLIFDLLFDTGAVFYGWKPLEPSIGLIAAVPHHPLIVAWREAIEERLNGDLSQRWAGIGYDLLWPLARKIDYTQIDRRICAPTHYTETGKFIEDSDPASLLDDRTVVIQLYNKMFFKTYGAMERSKILASNTVIGRLLNEHMRADPSWVTTSELLSEDPATPDRTRALAKDRGLDLGTAYIQLAVELHSSLTRGFTLHKFANLHPELRLK
ncbi:glycosyltransferase family 32 protein [Brevibacterium moorei]|uniref:glycosyltransferase family 32 protein n=1 Tax=Brevibacterium moorei TaxID=2968457 RepID=UPI00359CB535